MQEAKGLTLSRATPVAYKTNNNKNWYSTSYPATSLAVWGQYSDYLAKCKYTVGSSFALKILLVWQHMHIKLSQETVTLTMKAKEEVTHDHKWSRWPWW